MRGEPLKVLKQLLSQPTPSGYEMPGQRVVREYMQQYADEVFTDVHGNVHGVLNPGGEFKVMLAGHCDEIGLMVMHIDDKGYIYFSAVGGVNLQLLQGERVWIHTEKGPVPGVVGVKPLHLQSSKERGAGITRISDLWIDIGARNKREAARLVTPGDVATVDKGWFELRNDRIACRGFDDRIGAFAVADALRLLRGKRIDAAVYAVSTVQEEIGLRGARTAATAIMPDVGIAVDVGHATDAPSVNVKLVGEAKLGEGPILHRGPNFNHALFDLVEAAAKRARIKVQQQPIPRGSGTDANIIQLTGAGVPTALISIPNRYMHSPVEMVSLKDVEATSRLIAESIRAIKPDTDFVP